MIKCVSVLFCRDAPQLASELWLDAVQDYWADQNGSPTLDKAQDWTVVGAKENDTHTVIRLARRLHTHHVMDVQIQASHKAELSGNYTLCAMKG